MLLGLEANTVFTDGEYFGILTCTCGDSGCAGFYKFNSEITENEILWNVNNGDTLFKFIKEQYIQEVKSKLEMLINLCSDENKLEYFAYSTIKKKTLEELYSLFY